MKKSLQLLSFLFLLTLSTTACQQEDILQEVRADQQHEMVSDPSATGNSQGCSSCNQGGNDGSSTGSCSSSGCGG